MLGFGQLDAGFAALAGFVAGALAVRNLTPEQLGVYSILFLSFGVASQVPTQLVLSPAEVMIAHQPTELRVGSLRWSLPRGGWVSLLAAILVAFGALPLAGSVDLAEMTPLIVTAVTFTLLSPIQDHVRRVLHAAEGSGRASVVSATNLAVTCITAVVLLQVDVLLVPFGSMTLGNAASSLVAVWYLRGAPRSQSPGLRELVSMGRYLLVVGLSNSGGSYLAGTIVGTIAGPVALGYAEAARLVARPSEVSATGMIAAVGPRLMVASANRDRGTVRSLKRAYFTAVMSITAVYTLLVATPLGWGFARDLFPTAYEVSGLVLVTLVAQAVVSLTRPMQAQLMGLRRQVSLAVDEVIAQLGRLGTAATAVWIGAFAVPTGDLVSHIYKFFGYRRRLRIAEASASVGHTGPRQGDPIDVD